MFTMKEVAQKAGVSHGTVSNVINGSKSVSIEKIKRVEAAMKELGYTPNANARNLKKESSKRIILIVPNINVIEYLDLFENIYRMAREDGFSLDVRITNEVPAEECKVLNEAVMENIDGVIIVTCQPNNLQYFEMLKKNGLKIVFVNRDLNGGQCNYVGIDVGSIVENSIAQKIAEGKKNIAIVAGPKEYTFEKQILNSYISALLEASIMANPVYIEIANYGMESAFRSCVRLLQLDSPPEVILVSNSLMASGARKAVEIISKNNLKTPEIITITAHHWSDIFKQKDEVSYISSEVSEKVYEILINLIKGEKNNVHREFVRCLTYGDDFELKKSKEENSNLRILLNESPSSYAIKSLIPEFESKLNIKVTIDTLPYEQIYDAIVNDKIDGKYDIYSVDLPWLSELISSNVIGEIGDASELKEIIELYESSVWKHYGMFNNLVYAVPYNYTMQLLFYRKDLFENLQNQRLFYEWYKKELRPPETWEEFNEVARIFTRKFNPDSPTEFGTTLGGLVSTGVVCEFLPRLWGEKEEIRISKDKKWNKEKFEKAIYNYLESYEYSNPEAMNWWWDEQVEEFCSGNTAMMIMFTEHTDDLDNRSKSKVVGKTAAALIPSKESVFGGWSLACRYNSKKKKDILTFLKWTSMKTLQRPNAVLGRVLPLSDISYKNYLETIYNWYPAALSAYSHVKCRFIVEDNINKNIYTKDIENIISRTLYSVIKEKKSIKDSVKDMEDEFNKIIKQLER